MTESLSQHQHDALERYCQLLDSHPELVSGRANRPIVRDRAILETFAREHQVVLGVACRTPYLWLINDLVQSHTPAGTVTHPYLRLIAPPEAPATPGVVILATMPGPGTRSEQQVVLVEQERHATGAAELELPRGFGEPGTPPAEQALRELRQETGYIGTQATHLGTTLTDSGTTDRSASFFHIPVISSADGEPEAQEAILRSVLLPVDELWARIDSGAIHDAFTIQALALYDRHLARKRHA